MLRKQWLERYSYVCVCALCTWREKKKPHTQRNCEVYPLQYSKGNRLNSSCLSIKSQKTKTCIKQKPLCIQQQNLFGSHDRQIYKLRKKKSILLTVIVRLVSSYHVGKTIDYINIAQRNSTSVKYKMWQVVGQKKLSFYFKYQVRKMHFSTVAKGRLAWDKNV